MSLFSALIAALIVSSDTLNVAQDVSTQQKTQIPTHEIPTENDKNIKQVISESKTETINVNSNPNGNTNHNVMNSDNVAENPNLELMQQKEQVQKSEVIIIESQTGAPDEQKDTNYVEDSIEIDENVNDDNM